VFSARRGVPKKHSKNRSLFLALDWDIIMSFWKARLFTQLPQECNNNNNNNNYGISYMLKPNRDSRSRARRVGGEASGAAMGTANKSTSSTVTLERATFKVVWAKSEALPVILERSRLNAV